MTEKKSDKDAATQKPIEKGGAQDVHRVDTGRTSTPMPVNRSGPPTR